MDLNHHSGLIGLPLLGLPAQWGGKAGDHRLLGYLPNAHDLLSLPGDQYSMDGSGNQLQSLRIHRERSIRTFEERNRAGIPANRHLGGLASPEQALGLTQPEVPIQPLVSRLTKIIK